MGGVHNTLVGTPNYMAPEFVSRDMHGQECDIWSLGCILYRFIVGKCPFDSESIPTTFDRIRRGNYILPANVPPDAADLIDKLLKQNPSHRLRLDEIRQHPFILRASGSCCHSNSNSRILNDSTDSGRPNSTLLTSTTSSGCNPPPVRAPLINIQSSTTPYRPRSTKTCCNGLAPVAESDVAWIHPSPTHSRYHDKRNANIENGRPTTAYPSRSATAVSTASSPTKTETSSCMSSINKPPKLCTRRLEPCRASLENATFSILDSGTVVVEKVDDGGLHITEVVEISPDGETITVAKIGRPDQVPLLNDKVTRVEDVPRSILAKPPRSYSYSSMRRSLYGMYRFAANIVEFHRQTTPKVIINTMINGHYIRCFLMETLTDCVIEFPRDGVTFRFMNDGSIRLEDVAKAVMHIQPRDLADSEELIPELRRPLFRDALVVRQSAIEMEKMLIASAYRDNLDEDLMFPMESGRRLGSNPGNNRSKRSRAMSVMNMISSSIATTSDAMESDDRHHLKIPSSPVVVRAPRSDAGSEVNISVAHPMSMRRAKSLSREPQSVRTVGKENFFPGIGWVSAEPESSGILFVVRFLTGCRVQYFADRTLEVTDENGASQTYESHAHLPEDVKQKMSQFLKKMAEIGFER